MYEALKGIYVHFKYQNTLECMHCVEINMRKY